MYTVWNDSCKIVYNSAYLLYNVYKANVFELCSNLNPSLKCKIIQIRWGFKIRASNWGDLWAIFKDYISAETFNTHYT